MISREEQEELERRLRISLRDNAPELASLFLDVSDHWGYEDMIYRFYHQSFKVYRLQESTMQIMEKLRSLLPDQPMNPWFLQIVAEGTGKEFTLDDNGRWLSVTRPIAEAFFHARYFLEMACRYQEAPKGPSLPSGSAALLYLFNLR